MNNVGSVSRFILIVIGSLMLLFAAVDRLAPRARYINSNPAPAVSLTAPPEAVTINFSSDLAPESEISVVSTITLLSSGELSYGDGRRLTSSHPDENTSRRSLQLNLPRELERGLYWVSWTAIAARGGAKSFGRYCFSIGMPIPEHLRDDALFERNYRERQYRTVFLAGVLLILLGALLSLRRSSRSEYFRPKS
jgi:methionine-rich copper-binding protein CopC